MSDLAFAGLFLVAIGAAMFAPSWWQRSQRTDAPAAVEADELDAWLAMSPTPTHDRLCVEFFDAALGNKDGAA